MVKWSSGPPNTILQGTRYFKHKMTHVIPVEIGKEANYVQPGGNNRWIRYFTWARYQPGMRVAVQPPGAFAIQDILSYQDCARWKQVYKNYEQFAITGFKVKWIPMAINGSVNPSGKLQGVNAMYSFEDIDTIQTQYFSEESIVTKEHFR